MMMTRFIYPAIVMLALPFGVTAREAGGYPPCDVKVHFVSLCCGIDRAVEQKLVALVESTDLLVAGASRRDYWGREGERNYCLYFERDVTQEQKDGFVRKIHGFIPKGTSPNHAQTWIELPQDAAEE